MTDARACLWAALAAAVLAPSACGREAPESSSGGAGLAVAATSASVASSSNAATSGGGVPFKATCDAPPAAPSMGSCYQVPTLDCGGLNNGAGGAPSCASVPPTGYPACDACTVDSCCAELSACSNTPGCFTCWKSDPAKCTSGDAKDALAALVRCAACTCKDACGYQLCNPVTNAGCPVGQACQPAWGLDAYACAPAGNAGICQACDNDKTLCGGGLTCAEDGGCGKWCCSDGDCGKGICDTSLGVDSEGVTGLCVKP